MKNPYRSLLERPLRAIILLTIVALFLAKLIPGLEALYDRSLSQSQSVFLAVVGFGMGLSCLVDLATVYLLTLGWGELVDRPWVIFLTPVINIAAAGAFLVLLNPAALFNPGAMLNAAMGQPWWALLAPLVALVFMLILQFVSSVILYKRLR